MTTVACNVCSMKIVSENDRIYCFGGCDQILHTRCSDLSDAAAKAVRENNALQYMCFACRKKQTSLNDFQKQFTQLAKKVDELFDCIDKINLTLPNLVRAEFEKNNAALLPSVLSALSDKSRGCSVPSVAVFESSAAAAVDKPSYANVVRDSDDLNSKGKKRKAADDLNTNRQKRKVSSEDSAMFTRDAAESANNTSEGGLLRSGKRRNNVQLPMNNPISTPLLQPLPFVSCQSPCSPQRKSSTIMKMEQTVLIKPNAAQPADATKSDICEKLDPIEFAVKELRMKESGEVVIRCENQHLASKLFKAATDRLSEKYTVSTPKPLKPRLKIVGFSKSMNEEKLVDCLKKQNQAASSLDIQVIRITCNDKRKSNQMTAILETDARGFDVLMNLERVILAWDRCRVTEATDVGRCFNCSEYGHKAAACAKPPCCPKCSGDHKIDQCQEDAKKCVNCHQFNTKRQPPPDELLDVTHSSWSSDCPIYQKQLKKARQRIDFSI
ncbi:uncharacterized protein LOC129733822 [Wyeomyia smithii]|uniref:uncharacterized protein LOC129733822 n=1 Tax=Wyeomyia smithii TaxID=174621 RepID=UPI002467B89D|nr:uncharacterized protein LOC129733822 [Wyeomyia smithii]XP_055551319.1 uncharacterized protein LOC129733822 [Wyeomyia smithii]